MCPVRDSIGYRADVLDVVTMVTRHHANDHGNAAKLMLVPLLMLVASHGDSDAGCMTTISALLCCRVEILPIMQL